MRVETYNGTRLTVVGNFFAKDGIIYSRLAQTHTGVEYADILERMFRENGHEDYQQLSRHDDPIVRLLVAHNLECTDTLRTDKDARVREKAAFIYELVARPSTYHHEPRYSCIWTSGTA